MLKLHDHGILHRDLKASNVLVQLRNPKDFGALTVMLDSFGGYDLDVVDFESSVGVVGTGFWRAPEVLLALKNRSLGPETWTKKCDVYSYAMTCYELMTGRIPFEDHVGMNADKVINGARPLWPNSLWPHLCKLVERCWDSDPSSRPNFHEIVDELQSIVLRIEVMFRRREAADESPVHYILQKSNTGL
jgi:serine/threonine protein kinase